MSLLWADDFSTYGSGGQAYMLNGPYAELSGFVSTPTLVADPDPSGSGAPVIRAGSSKNTTPTNYADMNTVRKALPADKSTLGGFVRLWMATLPTNNGSAPFLRFASSANTSNVLITVSTIGELIAYRGDMPSSVGRTLLGSSTGVLVANAWNHIEWKIVFHASAGSIEIRVNGVVALSLTSQNTLVNGTGASNINLGCGNYVNGIDWPTTYFRDFVLWDTSGSYNNDFFGPCQVLRRTVNSDISFNWTPSTGTTGYTLIDEVGPNDADYISADVTQTTQSEFGIENLAADVTSVRGFLLIGRMKASDGGDCKVQMGVKSNGDQGLGTDRQITTAYTYWWDVVETSPDTGVPFTPTEFNAATFTIDRTT